MTPTKISELVERLRNPTRIEHWEATTRNEAADALACFLAAMQKGGDVETRIQVGMLKIAADESAWSESGWVTADFALAQALRIEFEARQKDVALDAAAKIGASLNAALESRDALAARLATAEGLLQSASEATAYSSHDDSVGYRICCGVASYLPHEKNCETAAFLAKGGVK